MKLTASSWSVQIYSVFTVFFLFQQRLQELLVERESIQAEYDALENDYTLAQLELRAARERIGRIMGHLERSEQLVALKQEEKDVLQNKVNIIVLHM